MKAELILNLLAELSSILNDGDNVEDDHARTATKSWVASVRAVANQEVLDAKEAASVVTRQGP